MSIKNSKMYHPCLLNMKDRYLFPLRVPHDFNKNIFKRISKILHENMNKSIRKYSKLSYVILVPQFQTKLHNNTIPPHSQHAYSKIFFFLFLFTRFLSNKKNIQIIF